MPRSHWQGDQTNVKKMGIVCVSVYLNVYVCVHGKGSQVKCIYKTGALAAQEDRIHTNSFFFVLLLGTATLILIILVGAVTLIFVILRRTRKSTTEETVCAREVVHVSRHSLARAAEWCPCGP